jgi:hypothetical protein
MSCLGSKWSSFLGEATRDAVNAPSVMTGAASWARMEFRRKNWKNAAEAYERALAARSSLLATQTLRSEKESWLTVEQDLAAGAAFTFAKNGDLARAAVTLENGVAMLLSEMLALSGRDEERLRAAGHVERADEFAASAEEWRSVARLQLAAGVQIDDARLARHLKKAHADFVRVLNRIRNLPGFAAFQAPTSIYELQNIAAQFGGPLVYAAATQHGTLILFVEAQSVRGVWTGLTNTRLSELLVRKRKDGRWTGFLPHSWDWAIHLRIPCELLPVLEDQPVAPLREQLLRLSYKRVGLVLTGKLSLLPVSACLLDDVCVHLQVNGRSLSSAEDEARRRLGVETVLAVGNPLPSENPLPAAELEAAMAAAHFSQPMLMAGTAVDAIRVIEGLQSASHLHLACHGYLAAEDALQSALHLGGPNQLTVRDLLFGSSLPKSAKLAVLSACQSAVPDFARLPDEIIGLPVAFLQAGVPAGRRSNGRRHPVAGRGLFHCFGHGSLLSGLHP